MSGGEIAMMICSIIAALGGISVAIIETRNTKERKRTEARALRRAEESRLSMELMSATCTLACVTATALRDGHTNGTLEPALEEAHRAQNEYHAWVMNEAARSAVKV